MNTDPQPLRLIENNSSYTSYLTISKIQMNIKETHNLFHTIMVTKVTN